MIFGVNIAIVWLERTTVQAAMGRVAKWEDKTGRTIAVNGVMRALESLRADRDAQLDARRERLAQKLFHEESLLQHELLDARETPEQKRAALAERAKAMWEARESERQATANACLERHFRENSDLLRAEFSRRGAEHTMEMRRRQVEDSTLRRLNELQEKTQWDECEHFEGVKANVRPPVPFHQHFFPHLSNLGYYHPINIILL